MEVPFQVKIIEQYHVSPPPHSIIPSISLPLTFLDIPWLIYPSNQTIFFFPKPPPNSTTTSIISILKESLSLTLHHFHPLAGKLSLPPPPEEPYICYTKGDTISLSIAESNKNTNHLSNNHPRSVTDLYSLLPKLPSPSMSRDKDMIPLLGIQITVFKDLGFSIGICAQHVAADERTLDHFMKCWASFSKSLLKQNLLFEFKFSPCFNRNVISDPGCLLKTTFLKQWWNCNRLYYPKNSNEKTDQNMVQSTFVLSFGDIDLIKYHILEKCKMIKEDPPEHMSPYVSVCAYIWICLLKVEESYYSTGSNNIYLGFNAGGITRLGYEIPSSYFGNCIAFGRCKALESELLGENGVVFAAKSIGKEIKRLDKDCLSGVERWIWDWDELNFRVLGSPKVDSYGIDFGWGKVVKVDKISTDYNNNIISLCGSRNFKGGIEIGVVLSKDKMSALSDLFYGSLMNLAS